jgi:hypothetical protein
VSGLPQLRNAIHLLNIDMFLPYPSNSSLYATRQHHSVRTRCAMRNVRAEKGTRHVSQGARLGVIQTTKASNNPPRVVRWPATAKKDARPRIAFASRRRDNSTGLILQTILNPFFPSRSDVIAQRVAGSNLVFVNRYPTFTFFTF